MRPGEIRVEIRKLTARMRASGIPVRSRMKRYPSVEAAKCNEKLFSLKLLMEKAITDPYRETM